MFQKVNQEADFVKDRLTAALRFSLSATKTLAFVVERYGVPQDFDSIAKDILESNKYIDALELTENGVITHVYPLEGNESVIGYDILSDSLTRKEALTALEKRELYFAGPLNLKQGGKGIVGRLPIFRNHKFFGFSAVLIRFSTLLHASGIDSLQHKNFIYQFSKINPLTRNEEFFLAESIPHEKRHVATMDVPDGEWKLYVMQKNKTDDLFNVFGFALLGFIFSVTAGLFAGYLVRQPEKLNQLVKEKTSQLSTEKDLSESIINSLPGIFYLFDRNGKYVRWNKNLETVTGYSHEEIGRMHPLDYYKKEEAKVVQERIDQVFRNNSGEVTTVFYTKDGKKMNYYLSGRKAIFNGVEYLIGMGFDISDRIEAENKLRERTAEIQRLTAHLEKIQEEERTRISREIHDELGQQLTCLKMDTAWVGKKISPEEKALQQKLNSMLSVIDDTVKSVRRISSELRPGILDDLGLMPALEWQSQEFEKHTGIKSIFVSRVENFNPEWNVSTHVFRVYQEALTNVARHAQATRLETTVDEADGHVLISIIDNGIGIDMAKASVKNSLGLVGMRERAFLFHGQLSIEGEPHRGTTVKIRIPLVNVNSDTI